MLLLLTLLGFKLSGQEHLPVFEHRLTCRVDSSSVEQILEKIVNENTLFFSYNPDILPKGLISLNLCNITVDELLRKILPVNDYRIDKLDNQLIITRKEATPIK